nr:PREDICTED: lipase member I-like [Equus przewalskii]
MEFPPGYVAISPELYSAQLYSHGISGSPLPRLDMARVHGPEAFPAGEVRDPGAFPCAAEPGAGAPTVSPSTSTGSLGAPCTDPCTGDREPSRSLWSGAVLDLRQELLFVLASRWGLHANGLGIKEPLGHIDFYPNGGKKQPGCPKSIFSGIDFIKCDHQRAVYLFMATLETNCNFISFPCNSYKDYKTGSCVDCDNFKTKSCPRLGYQAELWKDVLKEKTAGRFQTSVFLDTTGANPFCTYYFVLSITSLDETMKDGYITFKLFNQIGVVEKARLYKKNKSFYKLQEAKILAQFFNDVVNISSIHLAYFQSSHQRCSTCEYIIQRLMLKSLTYPERPPLCMYNFVLKESKEVFLNPSECITKKI